jgi:hypothetical protein
VGHSLADLINVSDYNQRRKGVQPWPPIFDGINVVMPGRP